MADSAGLENALSPRRTHGRRSIPALPIRRRQLAMTIFERAEHIGFRLAWIISQAQLQF